MNDVSYGLFAKVDGTELMRVLSNLINNSVEAIRVSGWVRVILDTHEGFVSILIEDNGKGIPPEVLSKLGQPGNTFGKSRGNGLGLSHAISAVQSWNGKIEFSDRNGGGTQVRILLPRAKAPGWFVPELKLKQKQVVVTLDDDASIHEIWERKLGEKSGFASEVELVQFNTGESFDQWVRTEGAKRDSVTYLCDYELSGSDLNGLQLIERLGIAKQSVMVTNRFDEEQVRLKCDEIGIGLIPKTLAARVPIALLPVEGELVS
jgi:hypothetical protein